jgi:hypothetical protein
MRLENATALKEWSSVVEALASGRQTVLIRKGGLADKGRVFAVEDDEFLLYPTYLHQQVEFIKPEYAAQFEQDAKRREGQEGVTFWYYAAVHEAIPVESEAALRRLDPLHIWNERFIEHRLQWKPENPAWVVIVRMYRLVAPVTLEELKRYRGCRSWVTLERKVGLTGAAPVLSDAEFAERVAEVKRALAAAEPVRGR